MKNRKIIILGLMLVVTIIIVGGISRNKSDNIVDVDVSLDELDSLGTQIDELNFEDLEGLYGNSSIALSLDVLDELEDKLTDLEFDDLEGLSEN